MCQKYLLKVNEILDLEIQSDAGEDSQPGSQSLTDSNASSITTVFSDSQAPVLWTTHKRVIAANVPKRSFQHCQYMRLSLLLSPRGEELLKAAVCSIVRPDIPIPQAAQGHQPLPVSSLLSRCFNSS